jgi:AraC-like DNA-binding protein
MKIQLEKIPNHRDKSSLSWLINPRLNEYFFWHFHPEIEIVFIEAEKGNRHVGEHFSPFFGSDLVLIGSNIPHLNFDYGIKGEYQKTVLHINENFLKPFRDTLPEFEIIIDFLHIQSQKGIAFGEKIKNDVGERFKNIHLLHKFEQVMEVIQILQLMVSSGDFTFLHTEKPKNLINQKEKQRLDKVVAYIQSHYHQKIETREMAEFCNLSTEAFCRYFKQMTKLTFTEYLNNFRINESKRLIMKGYSITDACYESGFESLSYFNRIFKKVTNENPSSFKKENFNR